MINEIISFQNKRFVFKTRMIITTVHEVVVSSYIRSYCTNKRVEVQIHMFSNQLDEGENGVKAFCR